MIGFDSLDVLYGLVTILEALMLATLAFLAVLFVCLGTKDRRREQRHARSYAHPSNVRTLHPRPVPFEWAATENEGA